MFLTLPHRFWGLEIRICHPKLSIALCLHRFHTLFTLVTLASRILIYARFQKSDLTNSFSILENPNFAMSIVFWLPVLTKFAFSCKPSIPYSLIPNHFWDIPWPLIVWFRHCSNLFPFLKIRTFFLLYPICYSQFPIPSLLLPIHYSQFAIPKTLFPVCYCQFAIPNLLFPRHYTQVTVSSVIFPRHYTQFTIPSLLFPTYYSRDTIPKTLYQVWYTKFNIPKSLFWACGAHSYIPKLLFSQHYSCFPRPTESTVDTSVHVWHVCASVTRLCTCDTSVHVWHVELCVTLVMTYRILCVPGSNPAEVN